MTSSVVCRVASFSASAVAQAGAASPTAAKTATEQVAFWSTLEPYLLPGAMLLGAIGVWLMLSRLHRTGRVIGGLVALLGFVLLGLTQHSITHSADAAGASYEDLFVSVLYWLMAGVTVIAAGATITMRSPVYSAVCFATTLLGIAGLFLLTGAQFLSIATVAVYAGAIVVMFLFVVMLAQSEGHAYYDRISWGRLPPLAASAAAALFIGGVAYLTESLNGLTAPVTANANPVLAEAHMAHLGRELFSTHLIAVEIAGTLLLVALVGAIAIVIQGRDPVIARRDYERNERTTLDGAAQPAAARELQPAGGNGRE
jgi:NADH-quinone oxidoreductase subunit J